jgi:hypothetical protein
VSESFGHRAVEHFSTATFLLGWRPSEFWEATPAELWAALKPFFSTTDAPERTEIERLQAQFPDKKHG